MKGLTHIAVFILACLSGSVSAQAQTRELTFSVYTDFGDVHVLGVTDFGFLAARNAGTEPITITTADWSGDPQFAVISLRATGGVVPVFPFVLQPGDLINWNFRFFPDVVGAHAAQLTITSDASGSPHIFPITARAVDTPLGPWNWSFVGRPPGTRDFTSIALDPDSNSVWYVSSAIGLFITRDSGQSWEHHVSGSPIHSEAFAIDPTDHDRLYVGSASGQLYASTDRGQSWTLLRSFSGAVASLTVGSDDGALYVPTERDDSGDYHNPGVHISHDHGATWQFYTFDVASNPLIPWDIVQEPVTGALYVATEIANKPTPYEPPLFKSVDSGVTWQDISATLPSWHGTQFQIDPENQDIYFLLEGPGLYRSSDQGASWAYLSREFWVALLLTETHHNRLYGGGHSRGSAEGGAFASIDGGLTFEQTGLRDLTVTSLALDSTGSMLHAATLGGIFVTPVMAPVGGFTDDPLVAGVTMVKAVHLAELRVRIDGLRIANGLMAFPWTDDPIEPGVTLATALHLLEARTALSQAYVVARGTPPSYADPLLDAGTSIRAIHVGELRDFVIALE